MYFRAKPGRKKIVLRIVIIILLLAGATGFYLYFQLGHPEADKSSVTVESKLTLKMEEECLYDYATEYLMSQGEDEIVLSVPHGEAVSFTILAAKEKELDTVRVEGEEEQEIEYTKRGNKITMNMNYGDVTVTPTFKEAYQPTNTAAVQTATTKYDLKLEGYDDEIKNSYEGLFIESEFLNALGKVLDLDQEDSKYSDIKTVTFIKEKYETDNSDIVGHFIIFNNDTDRKALSLFSKENKAYTFNLNYDTPTPTQTPDPTQELELVANPTPTPEANSSQGASQNQQPSEDTSSSAAVPDTSFEIVEVSTIFIDYVGGKNDFYNTICTHIKSLGYSTSIGTFEDYSIDDVNQQVSFKITLDNGAVINGVYSKPNNSYSFQ